MFRTIQYITKNIYDDYGIMQATIHDSVLTTPENVQLVKNEFTKHFINLTGFTPQLDIQDFEKEDLLIAA
jgi:hypothetical protein